MLWVYGHYKYFYSYSARIDFSRQNLMYRRQILTTKVDPRAVRVNYKVGDTYREIIYIIVGLPLFLLGKFLHFHLKFFSQKMS